MAFARRYDKCRRAPSIAFARRYDKCRLAPSIAFARRYDKCRQAPSIAFARRYMTVRGALGRGTNPRTDGIQPSIKTWNIRTVWNRLTGRMKGTLISLHRLSNCLIPQTPRAVQELGRGAQRKKGKVLKQHAHVVCSVCWATTTTMAFRH